MGDALACARDAMSSLAVGSADWLRANVSLFFALSHLGQVEEMVTVGDRLATTTPAAGADTTYVATLAECALTSLAADRQDLAATLGMRALAFETEVRGRLSPVAVTKVLALRAAAARYRGNLEEAAELAEAAVRGTELIREVRNIVLSRIALASIYGALGRYEKARPLLVDVAEYAKTMRLGALHAVARYAHAFALWVDKRPQEALAEAVELVSDLARSGDRLLAGWTHLVIVRANHTLGLAEPAVRHAAEAVRSFDAALSARPYAFAWWSRALLLAGDIPGALARSQEALRTSLGDRFEENELILHLARVEALLAACDETAAREQVGISVARIRATAARFRDPANVASYLAVPHHAKLLAIAESFGVDDGDPTLRQ